MDRATGARSKFSDFGEPMQGSLGFGPISLAIADLGPTKISTTTTTTTLPGECGARAPTFVSIDCRLDALIATVDAARNLKKLQAGLSKNSKKARSQKKDAEAAANQGSRKLAKSKLKKATRTITSVGFRLRSLSARKTIQPPSTRTDLLDRATAIQQDMQTLLKSLPKH